MGHQKVIKDARVLAITAIMEVEKQGILIPEAMAQIPFQLSRDDRNLAYEITYGTFRYRPGLERLLLQFCKPKKMPDLIRSLLLTSTYQLVFMRTPDYAVINEANNFAKSARMAGLVGLVNGVLRNVARKLDTVQFPDRTWLLHNWLADHLEAQYGVEEVAQWLSSWKSRTVYAYWSREEHPIHSDDRSPDLPQAYRRLGTLTPDVMRKRKIYTQNESSQAIAELIVQSKAATVLDLCAAPGGKACYVAAFGNAERIVANDSSESRLALLKDNVSRLDLDIDVMQGDACELQLDTTFDFVLLDAPCSGLGIIGRHPEIKTLRKQPADDVLREKQAQMMQAAWGYVKEGGYLLYTVCSLDKNEVPAIPEGAQLALDDVKAWLPDAVPVAFDEDSFGVAPNNIFDGFRGVLLKK